MTKKFEEEDFFKNYEKTRKKEEGIPNVTMNAPMVPRNKAGDIGLELEVEAANALPRDGQIDGVVAKTTGAMWNAKADGSLRGNALEYVVSTPINADEVPFMVNGLFDAFTKNRTKLANTNRCSTHVHINIGGLTVDQITAILALWTTFEEPLIQWCGEARVNNHYSLSSNNSKTMLEAWELYLRTGTTRWNEGVKYSALNILTINNFGSLEFRCGPAADKPEVPIKWALFLYALCSYAKNKYRDLHNIPRDLSELGGAQLLEQICKESGLEDFYKEVLAPFSEREFNDMALQGFRNAQNIVLGFPWERWSELIRREYVPQPFAGKKKLEKVRINVDRWGEPVPIRAAQEFDAVEDIAERPVARRLLTVADLPARNAGMRIAIERDARINTDREMVRRGYRPPDRPWPEWEFEEEYNRRIDTHVRDFQ